MIKYIKNNLCPGLSSIQDYYSKPQAQCTLNVHLHCMILCILCQSLCGHIQFTSECLFLTNLQYQLKYKINLRNIYSVPVHMRQNQMKRIIEWQGVYTFTDFTFTVLSVLAAFISLAVNNLLSSVLQWPYTCRRGPRKKYWEEIKKKVLGLSYTQRY